MRFKRWFCLVIFIGFLSVLKAIPENNFSAKKEEVRAINNYISFVNESIHGLLIVNKLLENYNLDLNKYVDLESYKINNYTNEDLPFDIFKDPDKLFFNELTPYEWYERCKLESKVLPPSDAQELNRLSQQLFGIIQNVNDLRFNLDKLTKNVDLSKRENIGKVYMELENAVGAFENFFTVQQKIEMLIHKYVTMEESFSTLWSDLDEAYNATRSLLIKIRRNDNEDVSKLLTKIKGSKNAVGDESDNPAEGRKAELTWANIQKSISEILSSGEAYIADEPVADHYKIYGKNYYYYNIGFISRFNRFGTGLASEINSLITISGIDKIKKFELPHLFKVIYPEKIEAIAEVETQKSVIKSLPTTLKARQTLESKNTIRAESTDIELRFYDHLLQDGDIVSINFNGDWILQDAEIEKQPQTIKLKLNSEGRNYLVLHANNLGVRPPNTLAVSYIYHGKKYEIVLRSDLNKSEMIEIILD